MYLDLNTDQGCKGIGSSQGIVYNINNNFFNNLTNIPRGIFLSAIDDQYCYVAIKKQCHDPCDEKDPYHRRHTSHTGTRYYDTSHSDTRYYDTSHTGTRYYDGRPFYSDCSRDKGYWRITDESHKRDERMCHSERPIKNKCRERRSGYYSDTIDEQIILILTR